MTNLSVSACSKPKQRMFDISCNQKSKTNRSTTANYSRKLGSFANSQCNSIMQYDRFKLQDKTIPLGLRNPCWSYRIYSIPLIQPWLGSWTFLLPLCFVLFTDTEWLQNWRYYFPVLKPTYSWETQAKQLSCTCKNEYTIKRKPWNWGTMYHSCQFKGTKVP